MARYEQFFIRLNLEIKSMVDKIFTKMVFCPTI